MTFEIILAIVNYFGSGQLASRKQTKTSQPGVNIPIMYLRLMH